MKELGTVDQKESIETIKLGSWPKLFGWAPLSLSPLAPALFHRLKNTRVLGAGGSMTRRARFHNRFALICRDESKQLSHLVPQPAIRIVA